jgi:hypothetical protein
MGWTFPTQPTREQLRERFRAVIIKAGYVTYNGEKILAQYFDEYMKDIPSFVKMLEEYERKNGV